MIMWVFWLVVIVYTRNVFNVGICKKELAQLVELQLGSYLMICECPFSIK